MKRRPRHQSSVVATPQSTHDGLVHRARRARRKGDRRKALIALREAAHSRQDDARLWTLYGVQCAESGKVADALQALGHAAWLRERARDTARARVTHTLCAQLASGGLCALRARFAA